jgi:hypothetical protein
MADYNLEDFVLEVDARMLELSGYLDDAQKRRFIKNAVETVYSRHKPLVRSSSVTGDGTFSVTINTTNMPGIVLDFSSIFKIEYPYESDQAEPNYLEDDEWIIIPSGTDRIVRFLSATPSASETIRFYYTYPRKFSATGDADESVALPDPDYYAVCDMAAALCLEAVANKLTATGNSALSADTVNYRSKAAEARSNAAVLRKNFESQIGIGKEAKVKAAATTGDWDTEYQIQVDWLTHQKVYS